MKKFAFLIVLNLIFTQLIAQQNLFNIPSGDITEKNKMFYQHQLNVYNDKIESKAHFVYGLGKGWDIGANLVGKGVYFSPDWRFAHNDNPNKGALYPVFMGTLQKQVKVTEHLELNAGGQIGWNLSNKVKNKKINYFSYLIGSYHIMERYKIVAGLYKTNQMYIGKANTFGMMAGYEIKLTDRWYLMGDWVSGYNDAAVMVLGGMYNVTKRVQVCAGWQIPNPNTPKPMGVVLELNLMGWDAY